jgi:hypothetical protein
MAHYSAEIWSPPVATLSGHQNLKEGLRKMSSASSPGDHRSTGGRSPKRPARDLAAPNRPIAEVKLRLFAVAQFSVLAKIKQH